MLEGANLRRWQRISRLQGLGEKRHSMEKPWDTTMWIQDIIQNPDIQ